MYRIVEKKELSPVSFRMWVEAPRVAKKAQAGQFVIIRLGEHSERIPLTIADFDRNKGTLALFVQIVGKSSDELSHLQSGDSLLDLVGPLGTPTHIEKVGNFIGVGGGVGVAPLYPITRAMKQAGNHVTTILGARDKSLIILEDEMRQVSDQVIMTTNDGSAGIKGLVIDPLKKMLEEGKKIDLVFAIGPMVMMRAVCDTTRPYKVKTMVSLDTMMLDGTGMCGACRVNIGSEVKFTCVDGPDFDGHLVNFDELMIRQKRFATYEKEAWQKFKAEHEKEGCKCRQ